MQTFKVNFDILLEEPLRCSAAAAQKSFSFSKIRIQSITFEIASRVELTGNFKIELFVIRVGDWGGYMLLDCDDPTAVHKFCSMLPAFVFEARPVISIDDAVRVELEFIAFRDGLKGK